MPHATFPGYLKQGQPTVRARIHIPAQRAHGTFDFLVRTAGPATLSRADAETAGLTQAHGHQHASFTYFNERHQTHQVWTDIIIAHNDELSAIGPGAMTGLALRVDDQQDPPVTLTA